jgi:hypothetical protein
MGTSFNELFNKARYEVIKDTIRYNETGVKSSFLIRLEALGCEIEKLRR